MLQTVPDFVAALPLRGGEAWTAGDTDVVLCVTGTAVGRAILKSASLHLTQYNFKCLYSCGRCEEGEPATCLVTIDTRGIKGSRVRVMYLYKSWAFVPIAPQKLEKRGFLKGVLQLGPCSQTVG